MNSIMQESRGKMGEKKEIYSYMLRFNKELERDREALDRITQFCRGTGMTMRDAILLILSTVDTSALQKNICSFSLTVTAKEQVQDIEEDNKRKNNKKSKNVPVYEEQQEEEKNLEEKEEKDLFLNPRFKEIFSNF